MKALEINRLEEKSAGGFINGFCAGFGAAALVYGAGVAANFWNPVGWAGGIAGGVITAGCIGYSLSQS
ncbi:hypothetical protein [Pleomorphovibrio marinus]|uniref:hypothetical protein n=1 Tax=Pleomorphovibrio marinus TaxID=2164132 RepID=UPI000E0C569E|nr:hypothetical protein [Pleomorphovibrio marinus]